METKKYNSYEIKDISNKVRDMMIEYCKSEHKGWSKKAESPHAVFHITSNLFWHRYEDQIKILLENIPKNAKVLDIGCGWNHISAVIKSVRPDVTIIGIDLRKVSIWEIIEKKYGCKSFVDDAENLRFKNNEFDIIFSFGVMEHTNNKKFLKENYRALKKNGIMFIFNLPTKYAISEIAGKLMKIPYHRQRYTKFGLTKILLDNKFGKINIEREFIIPAQVARISDFLENFFNKHYLFIDKFDKFLMKFPFSLFLSKSFFVKCEKV